MATIVPRATLEVRLNAAPQARNTTRVDTSENQRIGQIVTAQALQYGEKIKEQNDLTAVMKARRELSDWEASTFDPANPEGIAKYRGQNAMGANEALVPDLDKRIGEIGSKLTPSQRARFDQVSTNFRDQVQGRLNGHMDREHSSYLSAEQKATLENLGQDAVSAAVSGDFGRQDAVANEMLAINRARRQAEGMGEELIKAEERGIVSAVRKQSIDGMATARPFEAQAYYERYADQMTPEDRAQVERMLYPVVRDAEISEDVATIIAGGEPQNVAGPAEVHETFDAAMASLGPTEGGFQKDPNDKGNYRNGKLVGTKYGISARAHPDVDIKNLTPSQARAIYKAEYWDAIGADKLPPEIRGAAFDAAVNNGVPTAKRWLESSGGDLDKFQALRRGRMRAIQSNDPTQRQWSGGWGKRVDKFDGGQPTQPRSEADALAVAREKYRDPRDRAKAQADIREHFQLQDMRRQEQEKAMSEYIHTSMNQAANPAAPLRELIGADAYAYAERKGQIQTLENQRKSKLLGTLTQDDPILVDAYMREAVLSPNTFMKRDLYSPEVSGRLATDTLTRLLDMQKKAKDPAQRAEWATQQERIDAGLRILKIDDSQKMAGSGSSKKNKVVADKQAAYGIVYREAERALIQTLGNKKPTPEQLDTLQRKVTRSVAENPWLLDRNNDGTFRAGSAEAFGADMPAAVRAEAIQTYQAKYGSAAMPTEAQIVQYAALKSKRAQ